MAKTGGSGEAVERCEFCSLPIPPSHRHVLELATRKIVCACDACALRFDNISGKWRLIPRDTRRLADFRMTDPQWESFSLPIQLSFFFHSTPARRLVALYPSPAGATESLLSLNSWQPVLADNPILDQMQPDVEALLVNRLGGTPEYYLAPVDVCFELVGRIRLHWRGFSGGDRVWREIDEFFDGLRETSRGISTALMEVAHA